MSVNRYFGAPRKPTSRFRTDDMLATQTMANLDGKRLSAVHVDDDERSELLPITQLVVDKSRLHTSFGRWGWQRTRRWTTILRRLGRLLRSVRPSSLYGR